MSDIGVYTIKNIVNGKQYIGSTATIGFEKRWNKHRLDLTNNNHHSIYLQRSWNNYGATNFKFEVIEECNPENCLIREQHYIDTLKPEYNMCPNAGSTLGIKLSKEYCDRLRIERLGANNNFYGKRHSDETKQLLSEINKQKGKWKGNKNPKFGKGDLIKGRNASKFSGDYMFYHEKYGEFIGGQFELCKKHNLTQSAVSMVRNGLRKRHKGWVFVKKVDN